MRTTIHVNLPEEMKHEMELVAKDLGCTSVANYVTFLHNAVGAALGLPEPERRVLQELAVWQNFRNGGTPDAVIVARTIRIDDKYMSTAAADLQRRGLVKIDRQPPGKYYARDMMLADGRHVWVTKEGMAAALVPPDIIPRLQILQGTNRRPGRTGSQ